MRRNRRNKNNKNNDINNKKIIKFLSFFILILVLFFIVIAGFYNLKNSFDYKKLVEDSKKELEDIKTSEETPARVPSEDEEDITFTLSAIGDIMCHNTQYKDAYNSSTKAYDFNYVFDDISYYTKTADITVGNLETSFAGEAHGYSSYPTFNTPDALAYNLKSIGLDVITTAGNHALDMGFTGLSRTIDVLDNANISHLGTYKTQEEQNKVLFKYVKGIKIAFINYTYGTNGISVPSDKPFCINLIDKDLIKKQIETAKSKDADIIISCMHWGTEYKTTPNSEQEDLANFLFENGVDIILGNHPHVLEPMEKRTITLEDGTTKDCFVIYALGNFMADQNLANTRDSIILNLEITKHVDGSFSIDNSNYIPIYMYKNTSVSTHKMKLLDIKKCISNYENSTSEISESLYKTLKSELNNITSILEKE